MKKLNKLTLSELIEKCGKRFTLLERHVGNPFNYFHDKKLEKQVWWSAPCDHKYGTLVNPGSTPEEAVTNLLLALKK